MLKNAIYTIISILCLAVLPACQDDYFDKINGVGGEGTGSVTLTVDFQPAAGADLKSRAIWPMPGGGMGDIYDMVIVNDAARHSPVCALLMAFAAISPRPGFGSASSPFLLLTHGRSGTQGSQLLLFFLR